MFLVDHFPSWTPVTYDTTATCLDQIAQKNADCIIISNYRYSDIARLCERLGLTTLYTGVDMDYCLAVKEGNTVLYAILAKIVSQVPDSTVNAALIYYSTPPSEEGLGAFLMNHPVTVGLGVFSVVMLVIVVVLLKRFSAPGKKKTNS